MENPILIIGGKGKTGSRVADRLRARGQKIHFASRSTGFDWTDRSTWAAALDGVSAAYITYYPDLAVKTAPDDVEAFAKLAVSLGVKRLVLLSGRGEPAAQESEKRLIASGADWTIVRASWFNQNFDEGQFQPMILEGEMALPVSHVREPFIDANDIADVVVAALTDPRHIGELYEVTGPQLLTFAETIAEISKASGRKVVFQTIPTEDFVKGLTAAKVPGDVAELLVELFTVVLDGRNEYLTDGIERALGRPPKDFADYARDAAARGAWK
ncbi:NmrA family NAD(P)-binding protein [Rhizobium terrae]|uniref:NmrA family NAD(P)-binding protein n=1 Tax=Rhizobium terrae TaxID=2171756 RepID=UPI000E3E0759|nr:NmrA family NAD(P)-binding protein [Rhizobium terrae]